MRDCEPSWCSNIISSRKMWTAGRPVQNPHPLPLSCGCLSFFFSSYHHFKVLYQLFWSYGLYLSCSPGLLLEAASVCGVEAGLVLLPSLVRPLYTLCVCVLVLHSSSALWSCLSISACICFRWLGSECGFEVVHDNGRGRRDCFVWVCGEVDGKFKEVFFLWCVWAYFLFFWPD